MAREKLNFLVDEDKKGRKHSVLLPIGEYRELLEDLADPAAIAERKANRRQQINHCVCYWSPPRNLPTNSGLPDRLRISISVEINC